jgi:hypothetical protein
VLLDATYVVLMALYVVRCNICSVNGTVLLDATYVVLMALCVVRCNICSVNGTVCC